jgi:hypothetical protein
MEKDQAGGPFRGPDGKLSSRKIRAWISFGVGLTLLGAGLFSPGDVWARVVPGAVALAYSLIESGFLTMQNIQGLITKAKP